MWTNEGPSLYLTENRSQVVTGDDPRARYLLVAQGSQLELAEAERWGLTGDKGKGKAKADQPAAQVEQAEQAEQAELKAKADQPPNKSKLGHTENKGD